MTAATSDERPSAAPVTARGRRTRSLLLEAGRAVFEEAGFGGASVDAVCARAGVSHGTFYTYFDSLPTLFREVATEVVAEMFAATTVGTRVPDDPRRRIEEANRLYLRAWARNSRFLRVLEHVAWMHDDFRRLQLEVREAFVVRGADGLRRLQEAGLASPDLPPRLTAVALGGMVEHLAHVWLDLGEDLDEEQGVAILTDLWARAIGLGQVP